MTTQPETDPIVAMIDATLATMRAHQTPGDVLQAEAVASFERQRDLAVLLARRRAELHAALDEDDQEASGPLHAQFEAFVAELEAERAHVEALLRGAHGRAAGTRQ